MGELICCGFGHRVMLTDVEKPLRETLERLAAQGITAFYTGGMGEFDELFVRAVRSIKRSDRRLRLVLVLPYLTRQVATERAWYDLAHNNLHTSRSFQCPSF